TRNARLIRREPRPTGRGSLAFRGTFGLHSGSVGTGTPAPRRTTIYPGLGAPPGPEEVWVVPKSSRLARQRAMEAAAQARREQAPKPRIQLAWLSTVAAPLAVVLVLVLVRLVVGPPTPAAAQAGPTGAATAPAGVLSVPASVLDAVGKGSAGAVPKRL